MAKDLKKTIENEDDSLVMVDKHELHFTHRRKLFFPESKITKGNVIDYYNSMYKFIGPYVKGRAQSLKRNPNGIADVGFYQKDAPEEIPDWIMTIRIHSGTANKDTDYIVCNDKATLLYMVNLGCIEINPWFSRVEHLYHPDYMVIDIDPSDANSFEQVIEATQAVKEVLDKAKATCFCKTSGATGLHVYVPLGTKYTFDESKDFAHVIAAKAQELLPSTTTLERTLSKRGDRIYLDYLQNRRGQTLACPYSLRPRPGATASAPLKWTEVIKGLHPAQFDIKTLPERVEKTGDLFHGIFGKGIDIKKCLKNLGV